MKEIIMQWIGEDSGDRWCIIHGHLTYLSILSLYAVGLHVGWCNF